MIAWKPKLKHPMAIFLWYWRLPYLAGAGAGAFILAYAVQSLFGWLL